VTKFRNLFETRRELYPMKEEIENAINQALGKLLERDLYILTVDINERTISHMLAVYLEPYFCGWNIDCEYNRNHNDAKRLERPRRNVRNDDTQQELYFRILSFTNSAQTII